jgi:hypothetical protein
MRTPLPRTPRRTGTDLRRLGVLAGLVLLALTGGLVFASLLPARPESAPRPPAATPAAGRGN